MQLLAFCNCFHWAAATWLHLHLVLPDNSTDCSGLGKHLHLQLVLTILEPTLKLNWKTRFSHRKIIRLQFHCLIASITCLSWADIPSHSCFQSWVKRGGKGTEVSLEEDIKTRAESWMGLKRKPKSFQKISVNVTVQHSIFTKAASHIQMYQGTLRFYAHYTFTTVF